jgi:hypothetical protein
MLTVFELSADKCISQLLELLVELNSCPQIPALFRYDLEVHSKGGTDQAGKLSISKEDADVELHKARNRLRTGEISLAEYRDIEAAILKSPEFAPSHDYASLLSFAPASNQTTGKADDLGAASSGFLTVRQEEQYIHGLDAYLEGVAPHPRPHAQNSLGSRSAEKNTERERETQLKNPVSVYNWLRKHQPQVFLQDNEAGTEKTPRATGSRSSARKSAQKDNIKQEKDYDDEGIAADSAPSARGKRKRDDDPGYRPKGGNSRGVKRRKETKEDSVRSKRTKKLSLDAK